MMNTQGNQLPVVDLIAGRYMSTRRFAEITGRKETGIKEYLRKGKLAGKKDGSKWLVDWLAYEEKIRNLPDNGKAA